MNEVYYCETISMTAVFTLQEIVRYMLNRGLTEIEVCDLDVADFGYEKQGLFTLKI